MPKLTHAAIERKLRGLLGSVVIRSGALKNAVAQVDVNNRPHLIILDPLRGGLMDSLIHELLHLAYNPQLEWWGKLEEDVTEAVEFSIVKYINRSPSRVEWWRRRLDEALADAES